MLGFGFQSGESDMRVFLGIIIGVFLTIASAYVIDSMNTGPATAGATAPAQRPMVNWDVVDHNWRAFTDSVRLGWNRLTKTG
jgi:hypothetical protein